VRLDRGELASSRGTYAHDLPHLNARVHVAHSFLARQPGKPMSPAGPGRRETGRWRASLSVGVGPGGLCPLDASRWWMGGRDGGPAAAAGLG
jgi:hypothetical protein